MDRDFEKLINEAKRIVGDTVLSDYARKGSVSCALLTKNGNIYSGVCIDTCCGIGFCAEHAAIAEMLKNNESRIIKIVALSDKNFYPPCGRCRELIRMVNPNNEKTKIMTDEGIIKTLKELLPDMWKLD